MQDRLRFRAWNGEKMIYNANNNSPLILMQCTGLKDKNGKLIYEGDICAYFFEDIGKQKAIIYFNEHLAAFLAKPLNDFQYTELKNGEVIGNIYENKELLND